MKKYLLTALSVIVITLAAMSIPALYFAVQYSKVIGLTNKCGVDNDVRFCQLIALPANPQKAKAAFCGALLEPPAAE